jgi:hypothetical protein
MPLVHEFCCTRSEPVPVFQQSAGRRQASNGSRSASVSRAFKYFSTHCCEKKQILSRRDFLREHVRIEDDHSDSPIGPINAVYCQRAVASTGGEVRLDMTCFRCGPQRSRPAVGTYLKRSIHRFRRFPQIKSVLWSVNL